MADIFPSMERAPAGNVRPISLDRAPWGGGGGGRGNVRLISLELERAPARNVI